MHDSRLEFLSETNRSYLWFGLLGASAYAIGFFVISVLIYFDSGSRKAIIKPSVLDVSGWDVPGLLFYHSHGIDLVGPGSRHVSAVELSVTAMQFPAWLYVAVPIGALFFAGFQTVDPVKGQADDTPRACVRGSLIVLGYFPLVVVGATRFSIAELTSDEAAVAIPVIDAALVAGLAYPVVFGALGAYLVVLRS